MAEPQVQLPLSAVRGLTEFLAAVGVKITPAEPDDEDIPDLVFSTPAAAVEAFPGIYGTVHSVKYKLRNRTTNGLLATGAVCEKWSRPEQTRPKLVIFHRKWVACERRHRKGGANFSNAVTACSGSSSIP